MGRQEGQLGCRRVETRWLEHLSSSLMSGVCWGASEASLAEWNPGPCGDMQVLSSFLWVLLSRSASLLVSLQAAPCAQIPWESYCPRL